MLLRGTATQGHLRGGSPKGQGRRRKRDDIFVALLTNPTLLLGGPLPVMAMGPGDIIEVCKAVYAIAQAIAQQVRQSVSSNSPRSSTGFIPSPQSIRHWR